MISICKSVPMIVTVLFLLVLTLTTGQGQKTNTQQLINNGTNNTHKLADSSHSVDDYDWSNNDDYMSDDFAHDNASSDHIIPSLVPDNNTKVNETAKTSTNSSANENLSNDDSKVSKDDVHVHSESSSLENSSNTTPQLQTGESTSSESESPQTSSTSNDAMTSTTIATGDDDIKTSDMTAIPSSEHGNISSTEEILPSKIITQDYGDESNDTYYTPVPVFQGERIDPTGLKTWSVVVVSVLLSFAVIFTILYFIRHELIRRRKADQRRLLRGSISSEGYFYGDGEGNTDGKFEL